MTMITPSLHACRSTLEDPAVIRAAQRNIHQCKNGINKALRSAQGQPEYAFNDQHSRDGKVRIALRSAS